MAASRRKKRTRSAPRKPRGFAQAQKDLASRVRSLRKERKLTQQAAAESASIEVKHWQLIEVGGTNPTLATLLAIAAALNVEAFELLK